MARGKAIPLWKKEVIVRKYRNGAKQYELANEYSVSIKSISNIIKKYKMEVSTI